MQFTDSATRRIVSATAFCALFTLCCAARGTAQTADNVAVIINENSPASVQVGEYYIKKRAIPAGNVIRIRTAADENIDRARYGLQVETPIAAALSRASLQDKILYIVLTKGVPLRIVGTVGATGTVSSVDSELAVLYRRMTGRSVAAEGRIDNPYFLAGKPIAQAQSFTHREFDIFLVTRLDGFTVADAIALVDRSMSATTTGKVVLDQQDKLFNRTGETWLEEAAERLRSLQQEDRLVFETTVKPARNVAPVLGYYSWGSNDPNNRVRDFGMKFAPGSLAAMYVSSDARTFNEPPKEWQPTADEDKAKWYGGSPQSLSGDLVREGATGIAGHVSEPFLESTIRPQILFPAYLAGRNLAEAFYLAMPHLSWQTVVLGDPLCAPFKSASRSAQRLDEPVNPETLMPGLFSARRLTALKESFANAPERAAILALKGEALANRGGAAAARATLDEAARLAPNVIALPFQLALMSERAGLTEAAEGYYRQVIAIDGRHFVALNNLAYSLAVRSRKPSEALPFAQRAVALSPQHALLLDTLAYVEWMLGDFPQATAHITTALKTGSQIPTIRLRAALIHASAGRTGEARAEFEQALKLNPALESSDEAMKVREVLSGTPAPLK